MAYAVEITVVVEVTVGPIDTRSFVAVTIDVLTWDIVVAFDGDVLAVSAATLELLVNRYG